MSDQLLKSALKTLSLLALIRGRATDPVTNTSVTLRDLEIVKAYVTEGYEIIRGNKTMRVLDLEEARRALKTLVIKNFASNGIAAGVFSPNIQFMLSDELNLLMQVEPQSPFGHLIEAQQAYSVAQELFLSSQVNGGGRGALGRSIRLR